MRIAFAWILTLGVVAAPPEKAPFSRFEYSGTEMATSVKIVLYSVDEAVASRAAKAAFARIQNLNAVLSDYDPQSELSRLCRDAVDGKEIRVSGDLFRVLSRAEEISRASGAAFDVTVGPVVRLWRRARRLHRLPSSENLERARALVDHRLVRLEPQRRAVKLLKRGMRLDLGGIAKGYAAGEALKVVSDHGIACALVDIGGDIALGSPPPGMPGWRIAIAADGADAQAVRDLWLSGVAVASSADTEQFVVLDGRRYSHIIDPRTGLGLTDQSRVTLVAPDGMTADALASAVSVLGPREGLRLIEDTPGAAGRIVRHLESGKEIHESRRWKDLELAEGKPGKEAAPYERAVDPTLDPPVDWLLEALPLPAAQAESEVEMKPYTERIPGSAVTFDMVPIPGGKFLMGSSRSESNRSADESPQREVELEPFWMGKCEVTWEEYELWGMGYDAARRERARQKSSDRDRLADAITRPSKPYADMSFAMGRKGHPAICMTQLAAKMYCKWLSAKTGRYYRLPTEAEWEYACRAGTTTAYSFAEDPDTLEDHAWYFDNSGDEYHEVARKKPNPWGLFDMHGNVAEWVLDPYTPEGYKRLAAAGRRNPLLVPESIYPRVVRGGSWMDDADRLRSAARRGSDRDWKRGDPQIPQSVWYHTDAIFVGFRVLRPLRVPTRKEAVRYDLDPAQRKALAEHLEDR